jgi:regulatory protein YycI of two-component signal transduction system YycFG
MMKKLALVIIGLFLFTSLAFAKDNSQRISEIDKQLEQITQQIQQAQQFIQSKQAEGLKLLGAKEELTKMDLDNEKKTDIVTPAPADSK